MIKYFDNRNPGDGWRNLPPEYNIKLTHVYFLNYKFKIYDTVYDTWDENFIKVYEQFKLWNALSD